MGPIVDGLAVIARQVEIEANSATDNPLFDGECEAYYEGGNFLGQYIGVGMDQLRFYLGLMAKQLDAQIGVLVAPEFNNGLPASLVGNGALPVNMGLKGLQLTGNSIVPELLHLAHPWLTGFKLTRNSSIKMSTASASARRTWRGARLPSRNSTSPSR